MQYAPLNEERMSKVRSTLKQCVRDWSSQGERERNACYGPILKELEHLYPNQSDRAGVKVLIPGCGLGRLTWEIANRGFISQGNEFSYFMLLCSYLILNCCKSPNIFTIYPYIHETKNWLNSDESFRSVTIPDVDVTQLANHNGKFSMVAGDFMDIFSDLHEEDIHGGIKKRRDKERKRREDADQQRKLTLAGQPTVSTSSSAASANTSDNNNNNNNHESKSVDIVPDYKRKSNENANTWDVVATCYFIDCAQNILEYLRSIAYMLKHNGYWINFGPLLYHYSDMPNEVSIDLSYDEIKAALPYFGLKCLREELNQPSVYTYDDNSMLRQTYYCVSCTWQKVGEDVTNNPIQFKQLQVSLNSTNNASSSSSSSTTTTTTSSSSSPSSSTPSRLQHPLNSYQSACDFGRYWIECWNQRDIDKVLSLFVEHCSFKSPKAQSFVNKATLVGKNELRSYWNTALTKITSLQFTYQSVLLDSYNSTLVIKYTSALNGTSYEAVEVWKICNDTGLIEHGEALYGATL